MSKASKILDSIVESTQTDEAEVNVQEVIKELIDSDFSGSNEEQGKAAQLFRGLAFSEDESANKFMKALDKFTSGLNADDFK